MQGAGGARLGRAPKTGAQRSRRRCREALRLLQARRSCRPDAWHRGVRRVLLRRVKRGRAWQAVRRAACGMRHAGRSARSGARSGAHGTRVAMACTQADGRARKSASARPRGQLSNEDCSSEALRRRIAATMLFVAVDGRLGAGPWGELPASASSSLSSGATTTLCRAGRAPRPSARRVRAATRRDVQRAGRLRSREVRWVPVRSKRGADEARSLTEALPPAGASADGDDDSSASVRLRATHARAGRRFAAFAALPASARRA